jgi:uncharacterized protein involved in high-affinity Fe2+ transport
LILIGAACLVLAGCGSSAGLTGTTSKSAYTSSSGSSSSTGKDTSGMQMGTSTGMEMPGEVGTPVPIQTLAGVTWQGMKITAQAMTPVRFYIPVANGKYQEVNPPKDASFHLMVMLTDAHTGYQIPYSTVWATIRKNGKIVYDKRQWPMISEYMGTHYGNNVALPGAGRYDLTLTISPPAVARHVEYAHKWLKVYSVTLPFKWTPPS